MRGRSPARIACPYASLIPVPKVAKFVSPSSFRNFWWTRNVLAVGIWRNNKLNTLILAPLPQLANKLCHRLCHQLCSARCTQRATKRVCCEQPRLMLARSHEYVNVILNLSTKNVRKLAPIIVNFHSFVWRTQSAREHGHANWLDCSFAQRIPIEKFPEKINRSCTSSPRKINWNRNDETIEIQSMC